MNLEELEKILEHDNSQGNNLKKFAGIITDGEEIDPVEEKRKSYRG